jgi:hypothetical protein
MAKETNSYLRGRIDGHVSVALNALISALTLAKRGEDKARVEILEQAVQRLLDV